MCNSQRLRPPLTRPSPDYHLVTLSLATQAWSAPHPALTCSFVDDRSNPFAEARHVVHFSSRMALFAQVQCREHFCLTFARSAAGALCPARPLPYRSPAELLLVAAVAPDRFALVTQNKGAAAIRYWRERGEQVEEEATVALPDAALNAPGRVSCNAAVRGPFAHVHATERLVALHRSGTYAASVASPWPSHEAWTYREYAHMHVRRDGAVLVEVREDSFGAMVADVRLFQVGLREL